MFVHWKIERTPRNASTLTWDTISTYELTEFYDVNVQMSLGTGKDSFEFKINNPYHKYDNVFQPNDKITIYRKVNSTSLAATDLLMSGVITTIPTDETYHSNFVRINGYNYTEAVMNAITFVDLRTLTISEGLQAAINHTNANNKNFTVTWHPNNPILKRDNVTPFPIIGEEKYNKPLIDLLERYSSATMTQDGNYYYYVDSQNRLVWRPRTDDIDYVFNTSTDAYRALKTDVNTKDIVNFIIIKGGRDPANNVIQKRYVDESSKAKHGIRFRYITDYATISATNIKKDMDSLGITTGTLPSIALGSSYTFMPTWISHKYNDYVVVHNDTEYVNAVREDMYALLDSVGKEMLEKGTKGKLKVIITFQAGKGWFIGDVVQCTIPAINAINKNMRVQSAQYTSTEDIYTLEEDVGSI